VRAQLDEDLVTLHLAISLTIAAFLMVVVMSVRFPRIERLPAGGWLRLVALSAGGVFTVIVLGSLVHNLYFPGWPLMGGTFIPDLGSRSAHLHFLHRLASGSYAVIAVWLWRSARLRERPGHEVSLLGVAALLYVTNIAVGAAHVFTQVNSAALVAIHLGLASTVWVLTGAVAVSAARLGSVRGSLKV